MQYITGWENEQVVGCEHCLQQNDNNNNNNNLTARFSGAMLYPIEVQVL